MGPLDAKYTIGANTTLRDFVAQIAQSGFLQYSSTRTSMLGTVGTREVVKVFSPYYLRNREPHYLVSPDEPLGPLLDGKTLHFRFFLE